MIYIYSRICVEYDVNVTLSSINLVVCFLTWLWPRDKYHPQIQRRALCNLMVIKGYVVYYFYIFDSKIYILFREMALES